MSREGPQQRLKRWAAAERAAAGILDAAEQGVQIPSYVIDKTEEVIEHHWGSTRRAIEAGVKIATGSDSGVTPHGQNLSELAYMAQLGMPDADVILASTKVAAELMGYGGGGRLTGRWEACRRGCACRPEPRCLRSGVSG